MPQKDKSGLRARACRLAGGQRRQADIDSIFSWLRFRSFGDDLIRDIGDFAHHWEDRDRGSTRNRSRILQQAFTTWRWKFQALAPHLNVALDQRSFSQAILAGLKLKTDEWCRENIGVSYSFAVREVKVGLRKIESVRSDVIPIFRSVFQTTEPLTELQEKIIRVFADGQPEPLFNGRQLTEKLSNLLLRHGIILPEESERFEGQSQFISIYALWSMHHKSLDIGDKERIDLSIGFYGEKEEIHLAIFGNITILLNENESASIIHPIFTTQCNPEEWLENYQPVSLGLQITNSVEILDNGKLGTLD
jgi:hypothetical protein